VGEGAAQEEVAKILRREYLVTEERADNFLVRGGDIRCWEECTCRRTRSGTERVAELRRKHKAGRVLPALYVAGVGGHRDG